MQRPRNLVPQEVPTQFADQLRAMRDARDPRLNAVLATARSMGWRTATLADVLGMKATACSKRIERADPAPTDVVARQALRSAARRLTAAGRADVGGALFGLADVAAPESSLADAQTIVASLKTDHRQARVAAAEIAKAAAYRQTERPDVSDVEIPEPRRVQAMMNGRRLPPAEVQRLREMKAVASKVNGALEAAHPDRKVSEQYTAELANLVNREGFTPYYLAKELGVTHRAITSRLERHGYREPCPSVVGTASGVYRGRKIGDSAVKEPA